MEEKNNKKQYDITDFLKEKDEREEQIEKLKVRKACVEEEIELLQESYRNFLKEFLFKDRNINIEIDFNEME